MDNFRFKIGHKNYVLLTGAEIYIAYIHWVSLKAEILKPNRNDLWLAISCYLSPGDLKNCDSEETSSQVSKPGGEEVAS